MLENVPTAPESLPHETVSLAETIRARLRRISSAVARTSGSMLRKSVAAPPQTRMESDSRQAIPAAHPVESLAERSKSSRRPAPNALPTSASAASANPSRKKALTDTNCSRIELTASVTVPASALFAVNQAKENISTMVRIMMSRLVATVFARRCASMSLARVHWPG